MLNLISLIVMLASFINLAGIILQMACGTRLMSRSSYILFAVTSVIVMANDWNTVCLAFQIIRKFYENPVVKLVYRGGFFAFCVYGIYRTRGK